MQARAQRMSPGQGQILGQARGQGPWHSPMIWLAAVQAIAAYEWLISGLNKLVAGTFPQALHGVIVDAMTGNPNTWDVGFLKGVILPCCTVLGGLIECSEVLVGLVLTVASLLWVLGERIPATGRRLAAWAAAAACLGAALMNFNFYVAMGGTFPLISAANATDEGVSLDVVLLLVMLVLAAANLALAPRRQPRPRRAAVRRPDAELAPTAS